MAKIYKYKGWNFCDKDLSEEDPDYVGGLEDLVYKLERDGKVHEETVYYAEDFNGDYAHRYSTVAELLEDKFPELDTGKEVADD